MSFPIQITYRNVEAAPAVEAWVREQAEKLATFHERIIRCRVMIEHAHRHLRRGNRFQVKVLVSVPGGQVAVRSLSAPLDPEKFLEAGRKLKKQEIGVPQKELRQAVVDAFHSTGRRLQDLIRRQRSEVKRHQMRQARVVDLFPEAGYGFLETSDGRRIYFHRNSVLHGAFRRLTPGMPVTFAEEAGEQGPQASTVRLASRPRKPKGRSVVA
jgi:cold shock CspA family protein/ribosome-associated translation inhibitor RaiA